MAASYQLQRGVLAPSCMIPVRCYSDQSYSWLLSRWQRALLLTNYPSTHHLLFRTTPLPIPQSLPSGFHCPHTLLARPKHTRSTRQYNLRHSADSDAQLQHCVTFFDPNQAARLEPTSFHSELIMKRSALATPLMRSGPHPRQTRYRCGGSLKPLQLASEANEVQVLVWSEPHPRQTRYRCGGSCTWHPRQTRYRCHVTATTHPSIGCGVISSQARSGHRPRAPHGSSRGGSDCKANEAAQSGNGRRYAREPSTAWHKYALHIKPCASL